MVMEDRGSNEKFSVEMGINREKITGKKQRKELPFLVQPSNVEGM